MRPVSRRALRERLEAAAPRGARIGTALGAVALAAALIAWVTSRRPETPSPPPVPPPSASVLDPVLALPFGEGRNGAAPTATMVVTRVDALRAAYLRSDDRAALYRQWRERPELDARYLAFRAARDCERLRTSGAALELESMVERKGERERQMAAAITRCGTLMTDPVPLEELQALEKDVADAGHPAARVAYAVETAGERPPGETLAIVKKALASGDPLAFDEARAFLAARRPQAERAGAALLPQDLGRPIAEQAVAVDIAGCRLGNPCGPSHGAALFECGDSLVCLRDAEAWLVLSAGLDDDERGQAQALADRLVAAFNRGAVDEMMGLVALAPPLK